MKIYQLSKIGQHHVNNNEDAILATAITTNRRLIAVMDGCSMGEESHFASGLIKKILSKISEEFGYKAFIEKNEGSLDQMLRNVIFRLFKELQQLKNLLRLDTNELLSTLILGLIDTETKAAELISIGDGLVYYNGVYQEYEQDNKPDYIGYHLNEEVDQWYNSLHQRLSICQVSDISISTDGIFSFLKFDNHHYPSISEERLVELFVANRQWADQTNMLQRKLIEIENHYGLKPSDDLSIIRIILNE